MPCSPATVASGRADGRAPLRAVAVALAVVLALALACEPQGPGGVGAMVAPQPPPAVPPRPRAETAAAHVLTAPPGALDPLFQALAAAERGEAGGRVDVVVFGDSHTAGDYLTGRLRTALQARFGDAGRGFVLPGKPPIKHYHARQLRYGSDGRWQAALGGRRGDEEPFGLGGVRAESKDRRAEAWVETCTDCPSSGRVGRFDVYLLRRPDAGRLAYRIDGGDWREQSLRPAEGAAPGPDVLSIAVPDGPHRLTLRPGGGGAIELFGVALERDHPGVVVDSLGVVGRKLAHLHGWDWSVIGSQLVRRAPRLVVLQYGTNEVNEVDLDLGLLGQRYDELIARIHALVPDAALLILGPPDMALRPPAWCPTLASPPPPLRALRRGRGASLGEAPQPAQDEREVGEPEVPRVTGDVGVEAPAGPPDCLWTTPPVLPAIVETQRRAAARAGVAFFDSLAALGGRDLIDYYVHREPPLAYPDRVHFTQLGYERWADLLLAELLAGYEEWQRRGAAPR